MKKSSYFVILIIILILAIVPITRRNIAFGIGKISTPLLFWLSSNSTSARNFFGIFSEFGRIREENVELSKKLREAQIDKGNLIELKNENELLKKQIGYVENQKNEELVPAKIIGREPMSFYDYIIVDKGQNEGIKVGSAVMSSGALVGKVSEVNGDQSKIILITSRDSIIQGMLQESRSQGTLKGGLSGIYIDNIPQDIGTKKGEYVLSSGLGGGIRQGILIGQVVEERSSKAEIFKVLSVQPFVDFSKLELVFIIK